MKKILFILLLAVALSPMSYAQTRTPYNGSIRVDFPNYTMQDDKVIFSADVNFSALKLKPNQMIELTPILRSTKSSDEVHFAPLVITGTQRARVVARAERFGDYRSMLEPSYIYIMKRNSPRTHRIDVTIPFEKWMRNSEFVLVETCSSCRNDNQEYEVGITSKTYTPKSGYKFPASYEPIFTVSYIMPDVEPIKVVSDTYSAQLGFQVNRSNLLIEYGNNAEVLANVDKIVNEIKNDPLLTLKGMLVKGYASPEGNTSNNFTLSHDRAKAFINYLSNKYGLKIAGLNIKSEGMGEDWEGLRKAIAASSIEDKQSIINIIDNNADINQRKMAIRNLNRGTTYRLLLENIYPSLRRNEYTISYEVRGLNAEEAKELIWTRPNILSLNEMFMVSKLYSSSSKEYKDIFDIASRVYPNSQIAQFNTAAMEIEIGSIDKAISRLEKIESAESWNNLGVAYWHKGEYEKSHSSFQKAAEKGLSIAAKNLEQFNSWMEDKD